MLYCMIQYETPKPILAQTAFGAARPLIQDRGGPYSRSLVGELHCTILQLQLSHCLQHCCQNLASGWAESGKRDPDYRARTFNLTIYVAYAGSQFCPFGTPIFVETS
jgi:hypothetical protein